MARFKAIEQLTNEQEQMQEIYEYLRLVKSEAFPFEGNTPVSDKMLSWDLKTTVDRINELCRKMLQDVIHYPDVKVMSTKDREFYTYVGE